MAGDTDNPRIWLGADVYVAPVGATAPTDIATGWDAAWDAVGLVSEDGMAETREQESTDYWAWGGIHVRTQDTKHKVSFGLSVLEDTDLIFEIVNPGSTSATVTGVTTRTIKRPTTLYRAFGFELVDGGVTTRLVLPRCNVTAGNKSYMDDEMAMRELTITPLDVDDTNIWAYEITNDPQAASA